jgi:hypothetical protein
VPNNSHPIPEHTTIPLDILPTSLLLFDKPLPFLFFRTIDYLHKGGLVRIDAISLIIALVVCMSTDLIV